MPRLSQSVIRLALMNQILGMTIAALVLIQKGQPHLFSPRLWEWQPAHINLLLVGWMVQLALGVAYWIFPRLPHTRTERGRYRWAVSAFILLNGGVWLHSGAIVAASFSRSPLMVWQTLGLLAQAAGMIAFLVHIFPRIRSALQLAA